MSFSHNFHTLFSYSRIAVSTADRRLRIDHPISVALPCQVRTAVMAGSFLGNINGL